MVEPCLQFVEIRTRSGVADPNRWSKVNISYFIDFAVAGDGHVTAGDVERVSTPTPTLMPQTFQLLRVW